MARPRNRPETVDTKYFKGVSPLWAAPGRAPIDERYRSAVSALADWTGPNWPNNAETGFFPLRDFIINACDAWRNHDWKADRERIAERRRAAAAQPSLMKATRAFRRELQRTAFQDAKRKLCISLLNVMAPVAEIKLSYEAGVDATDRGLAAFEKWVAVPDRFPARYGAVEYDHFPRRIPHRDIAIALTLADLITGFRRDGHQTGSLVFPRKPQLSPRLPWKAIAEFAVAHSDDPEVNINPDNVETRVRSLAKSVTRIYRFP